MPFTFGQAKKALERHAAAFSLGSAGDAINTAVEELAASKNWQLLKQVRRFIVKDQYFPVPQDCDTIVRACIDGKPVSLSGPDYPFLSSGPGDLDTVPDGFAPINGLQDQGFFPTMYALSTTAGAKLIAFGTDDLSGRAVRVTGKNSSGELVALTVPYKVWEDGDLGISGESVSAVSSLTGDSPLMFEIERVILPEGLTGYVSLFAIDSGSFYFLAQMHPFERVPRFRRYRIPGFSHKAGTSYNVLAEVRLRVLPLVNDWDQIPFDSLLPIQYMLQSIWYMNSGEIKSADDYRQRALASLVTREDTQQERQGVVVLNSDYDGSLGEACVEKYRNI